MADPSIHCWQVYRHWRLALTLAESNSACGYGHPSTELNVAQGIFCLVPEVNCICTNRYAAFVFSKYHNALASVLIDRSRTDSVGICTVTPGRMRCVSGVRGRYRIIIRWVYSFIQNPFAKL